MEPTFDNNADFGISKKKKRLSQILLHINNKTGACNSLDEALEMLVNLTSNAIGSDRSTIFLNDTKTGELYSRIAQGIYKREIRFMNTNGIAGWVFNNDKAIYVNDPYNDPRFNKIIDERTGFVTRNILCVPVKTFKGELIGVAQVINKKEGDFNDKDLEVLEAITEQTANILQSNVIVEEMEEARKKELEFMNMVSQLSSELHLGSLLQKIVAAITKMLEAERSTIFLNDDKTNTLYTIVGEGLGTSQIRFPNHMGIAGTVYKSGKAINIPYAYADLRFNPSFDKTTGFFTRSILCLPIVNKSGKIIGVSQVLNKRGGHFNSEDETRLAAFTSQISIGLENAKLFDDVQNMKNYNDSILESMSNGLITINQEGKIVTCNGTALKLLKDKASNVVFEKFNNYFKDSNAWVSEKAKHTLDTGEEQLVFDVLLHVGNETITVNVSFLPLINTKKEKSGIIVMIEDISQEKRMKSTISLYMDPLLADKLLEKGNDVLGGTSSLSTVLFSDIRGFTTFTEELGAQGTVSLLNEYFTLMVECISREGGMLDKFIGDAIMAVYGIPFPHEDDADRAVRTALAMIAELNHFNQRRTAEGKMTIDIGVGLNTDIIVSGNIGSPKRMNYTAIGDGVNLASRLESACKYYGAKIIITESTLKSLKSTYRSREIDRMVVKGKTEAVNIYELLDFHTDKSFPNMMAAISCFKDGLELYKAGKFKDALKYFNQSWEMNPNDTCSKLYVDRCKKLMEFPPQQPWNGIWVMSSK